MENSYGIGVTNRYALFLDDESDPLETLKLKEQEKELKKKTKVAEKENKTKTETSSKGKSIINQKKVIKDTPVNKTTDSKREDVKTIPRSNAESKPERTYNKFNNENREERNNRRNRDDKPYNGPVENNRDREDRPRKEQTGDNFENRSKGGRPINNKIGGSRGPRGNRNFEERRGKREFDRQSGSDKTHGYRGVKPVDKREGGGAHNWGSHKDVIEEADKSNEMEQNWGENDKPETAVVGQNNENKETDTETENQPVGEEPKELTLDEWKAQKAGRLKPQYNIRKAGEGEDPSQWKKMYELNKKKDEDDDESEEQEYEQNEYPQRGGRQKQIFDIDIHFNDARRGGGGRGRGSRSGLKGNRSNKEPRSDRQGQGQRHRGNEEQAEDRSDNRGAPKVDDERDFPSLG